jgi:GDP-L-fucose synthase
MPAMIRKFHEAKQNNSPVVLWGSGSPMREFLFVDDLAKAVVFMMENKTTDNLFNVGFGEDISIKDLSYLIQEVVGHKGEIVWDTSKPDGTPKKLMDNSKIMELGWKPEMNLRNGIEATYNWFLSNIEGYKKVVING